MNNRFKKSLFICYTGLRNWYREVTPWQGVSKAKVISMDKPLL